MGVRIQARDRYGCDNIGWGCEDVGLVQKNLGGGSGGGGTCL